MSLEALCRTQLQLYPQAELQDLYKALFQLCMGPEHAISDLGGTKDYLVKEFEQAEPSGALPLLELLGQSYYRLHLRTAKHYSLNCEDIFGVFMASAGNGSNKTLLRSLCLQLPQIDLSPLKYKTAEVQAYVNFRESQGFPAVHHSDKFRQTYRPAYRVVHKAYIPLQWFYLQN